MDETLQTAFDQHVAAVRAYRKEVDVTPKTATEAELTKLADAVKLTKAEFNRVYDESFAS